MPVPSYLEPDLFAYRNGDFEDEPSDALRLFAALLIAGSVPDDLQDAVTEALQEGLLTPAGDVTYDADEAAGLGRLRKP